MAICCDKRQRIGIDSRRQLEYAVFVPSPTATILFDEAHSEAWTIRPALAAAMQPAHPADSSLADAAEALRRSDFTVRANADAPLRSGLLADCDAVVIAHPSDPAWERTTGSGSPRLTIEELDALEAFVTAGGGLVVLGETENEKYGNNLNQLLGRFGIELRSETVQDYEHNLGAPSWVRPELVAGERGPVGDVLAGVREACLYRATTIATSNGTHVLARAHRSATAPGAAMAVAGHHGSGRVVVLGDSDLFGDDCLGELDHRALWLNIAHWVTGGRTAPAGPDRRAAAAADPAWLGLRAAVEALAARQAPDGSLAEGEDHAAAGAELDHLLAALSAVGPRFPHQAEYLSAVREDLNRWREQGWRKPDFTPSLERFRPELAREDGIEHLVLFPMYKQNGSRDTCLEALHIRVPWPEWIAELERTRYDNEKFVPVQLLAGTRGYDSECAVLFPEMVATAERPVNNFGAIFCDREAERLRRVGGRAVELLALNLPPDGARLVREPALSEQAYILWDLIHDRAHSHGELPFDPFMIRQRAPYWMYSLEELRCDLTAYGQARELEAEGLGFARYVQYAIVLDRLLRFPITGTRVRNYDGLGGQLLFAHLHRAGVIEWSDNRLTVDWQGLPAGVAALHAEIETLYRSGIDRSKLGHWAAAHDLIAAKVPPATGSRWASGVRDLAHTDDPRPYVDLVLDDEFPLSIFYAALRAKLAT